MKSEWPEMYRRIGRTRNGGKRHRLNATSVFARATPPMRIANSSLLVDAVFLLGAYLLYAAVRDSMLARSSVAVTHAKDLFDAERVLRIDPEHVLNSHLALHPLIAGVCDYYYATFHFVVVIGVFAWMYVKHRSEARRWALAWYVMNLIGLIGFWLLPTAPPRLLPGANFVDTFSKFHTWGSLGNSTMTTVANQYAAFPSLHVGWALWSALAVASLSSHRRLSKLALVYPIITALVVLSTANHFLVDVVAGIATCLVGLAAACFAYSCKARRYRLSD